MKKASAKKARGKKKVVTKRERAASGATKRRSAGTKLEPTCAICQKGAHYSSTCPLLAQKLLAAVRKAANTKQIAEYLAANDKAFVQGMTGKPLKTLKRRSRGKPWHKTTATAKSRKVRKVAAKKSHAAKDKLRKPKPVKQKAKLPVTRKSTEAAYRSLKRRQWAWKPGPCNACAGELVLQSWKSCQRRGFGRLFYRPLCSLLHILMGHEKRCADEFQQTCTLAGLVEADGTSIRSFKQGSALVYRQLYGMIARKD
ncbi:unnamed protein product, partial [Effrenium voratum]